MNSGDEQVILFVVGMHRSGTSVYTRLLDLLGADLGDRLLGSTPGINDKGFWEHEELVALNEAALGRMGRAWYDFRPWPADWWQGPEWDDLLQRMRDFLGDSFPDSPLVALKDPRLCRLLPLWLRALEEGAWSPRVLLVLRDPSEVVASLTRRDPMDPEVAALLWLRYVQEAEAASAGLPRSQVTYDALLQDWRAVVARVGADLRLHWPHEPDGIAAQVEAEVDQGLRHHRGAAAGEEPGSWLRQAGAYYRECLGAEHPAEAAPPEEPLDGALYHTQEMLFRKTVELQSCGEALTAARATVGERDTSIQGLQQELVAAGQAHREALDTVEERDHQIENLAQEHRHALEVIGEKDGQIEHLTAEYEHAVSVVRERDDQLADLQERIQRVRAIPLLGPLFRFLMRPRSQ